MIRLGLILSLLFVGLVARAQDGSMTYCYGQGCASDPGYHGPMGSYNDPSGDKSSYDAYRYGQLQELRQYRAGLAQKEEQLKAQQQNIQNNQAAMAAMKKQVENEMEQRYPSPPPSVPDGSERRQRNPVPTGHSEAELDSAANPVWQAVQQNNPVTVAEQLNQVEQSLLPIPGVQQDSAVKNFVDKELSLSGVTDGQGLVKLPFADTPTAPLNNSAGSFVGADIRHGMNQLLAAESVVGTACAQSGANAALCAQAQAQIHDAVAGFYVLDRLSAMQGGLTNPMTLALSNELQGMAEFSAGVAKGMLSGAVSMVEGLEKLVTSPIETVKALSNAIYNYSQTYQAVKHILENSLQRLERGTLAEQGQVIGRAAFEVGALFVPVGDLVKVSEGGTLLKAATFDATARVLADTADVAKVIAPMQVRAELAAERLGMTGQAYQDFMEWAPKRLDIGDDGVLAITFARRITPDRFQVLMDAEQTLGAGASDMAKSYVTQKLVYEETILGQGQRFTSEQLVEQGQNFDAIQTKMQGLVGKSGADGIEVTRGVGKSYVDKFDRPQINSPDKVFATNDVGQYKSYRYSLPGQDALYTTVGTGVDVEGAIALEVGKNSSELIYGTNTYSPKNILDLTDPLVTAKLGIDGNALDLANYDVPQIIGYLAEKNNFDAILALSRDKNFKNLILLKGSL